MAFFLKEFSELSDWARGYAVGCTLFISKGIYENIEELKKDK